MFTKKTSRKEPENGKRSIYLDPFSEPDTEPQTKEETRSGYMAELEAWLDEAIFEPIERAISDEDSKELHIAFSEAKQQIKRRVLQSYHNGLKTNQTRNQKSYGQSSYRRN